LPKAKELVELLFSEGIIKVLYATETFAVGINMPAKTVAFASLEKFDGVSFRYLNSKEYFQLAGRAGRRGIDEVGYAISMVERGYTDLQKLKQISLRDDIPIMSRFRLSYNTVLNLVHYHNPKQREEILRMNFDFFQRKMQSNKQIRIMASYNNKIKILKSMGYVQDDKLTEKGIFATHIYSNELLTSELFSTNLYKEFSTKEINILVAAVIYEPRRNDYFTLKNSGRTVDHIIRAISNKKYIFKNLNKLHLKRMTRVIGDFSDGAEFKDLLELCSLDEGDLIRLIRRVIDMLRQIANASKDYDLTDKIHECINSIYRSVIRFEF